MWIVCKDYTINSDHLESIGVQQSKDGFDIVGYAANDPIESSITLGTYKKPEIAEVRYQMLLSALEEGRNMYELT